MKPILRISLPVVLLLSAFNLKAQDSKIQLNKLTPGVDTITNKFVKRIEGFNSNMPIAKMESKDNMPVAGLQRSKDNKASMSYVPVSFTADSVTLISKLNNFQLKVVPERISENGNSSLRLRMKGEK
jgi:hypothetical protein